MEIVIDTFSAISDSGKTYTVVEYQEQINAGNHQDPGATIPGMSRFQTSSGDILNRIDTETYQVVLTQEVVRKL